MRKQDISPIDFATTFTAEFKDPRFAARAHKIPVSARLDSLKTKKFNLLDELSLIVNVLWAAIRYPRLLLFSSRGFLKPELLATMMISFMPEAIRPEIIFYGEMFQPDQGLRLTIEKWIIKRVDRAVGRFIVYSQQDLKSFAGLWGIDKDKIRVSHYFTFHPPGEMPPEASQRSQHVFAGGKSFRDFEPVVEAARMLPEHHFFLATPSLEGRTDLPPNVSAGAVSLGEYNQLIQTAAVVLIPLQVGLERSTGMLTYLEAMWAKNPTIVTNALGVTEYVQDGVTGLVIDGTPQGYVDAIWWVLDPDNATKVQDMCEAAHKVVAEKYNFTNHVTRMLEIWDELLVGGQSPLEKEGVDRNTPF